MFAEMQPSALDVQAAFCASWKPSAKERDGWHPVLSA